MEGEWRGWMVEHPRVVGALDRLARLLIAPLLVAYRLRLIAFESAAEALSVVPGAIGRLLRRAWYRTTLESCGERLAVGFGTVIRFPTTRIGNDCQIGPMNRVGLADIGDHFLSAGHVAIVSGLHQHGYDRRDVPIIRQPGVPVRVIIGEDVWAGALLRERP